MQRSVQKVTHRHLSFRPEARADPAAKATCSSGLLDLDPAPEAAVRLLHREGDPESALRMQRGGIGYRIAVPQKLPARH